MTATKQSNIDELVTWWQKYLNTADDWQVLVKGRKPKATGCGPIYDLEAPVGHTNESFAICDMRAVKYAVPHYHANGETEIYIVLEGTGQVVVGGKVLPVKKGAVIVTPPSIAHYTIPTQGLVLAVINTPPFNLKNNIDLTESNPDVNFDYKQFKSLTQTA